MNVSFSSPKILIIDDEAIIRQSFSDYLEDLGYQPITAENGRIGLDLIKSEQPDLILTDLRMPEMSGLDVIKQSKKLVPDTPIIVVSGMGILKDAIEALRLGAWDYILKPIQEMSILEHQVKQTLEKASLIQENKMYQEKLEEMVSERTIELEETQRRSEQILNSIQSGVLIIDAETHEILNANPAALTMIEAQKEEVIGRICHKFICPTEKGKCPITNKKQSVDHAECVLLTSTGKTKNIIKTVITTKLGGRETLLESFIDISKRVRAENLLKDSEIRYKSIINAQTDLLCRYTPDGKITFANKAYCEFYGINVKEVIGVSHYAHIAPEAREAVLERINSLSREKPFSSNENQSVNFKGESYWFHWRNQAVLNDSGEITEYQAVGRNIDERKETEARLKLQSAALEATPNGIILTDINGDIQWANPAFTELTGYSQEEVQGKNSRMLKSGKHNAEFYSDLWKTISAGRIWKNKIVNKRKDGELYTENLTITPIKSPSGAITNFVATKENITERERIQLLQSTLYRISQAANHAYTPEELYPIIHRIIQDVMPAENFYIALHNEEQGFLHPVYFVDEKDSPPPLRLTGRGLTAYVLRTSEPLVCTAEKYEELLKEDGIEAIGSPPTIWLGIPLISSGKAVGVMVVQNYTDEKTYGEEEQNLLEVISTPIANTIMRQLAQSETETYAQINALLFSAAKEISETLELSTLYDTLFEIISEIVDCNMLVVSSFDTETKLIHFEHIIKNGIIQDITNFAPLPLSPDKEKGTQSIVIHTGKPIILNDYLAQAKTSTTKYYIAPDGKLKDPAERKEGDQIARSSIIIPLHLKGEVIGVLQIMSYKKNAYSERDLHIIEALGNHIAVASNNARLYEQAQAEIVRRIEAEDQLQALNIALEERVNQRTLELKQRVGMVEQLNSGMRNLLDDLNAANTIAKKNAEDLKQANAELESFSYSVSHDLRAPLRHIESFSRLLNNHLQDKHDEKSHRYIETIMSSTDRMRTLIEDLLSLSRTSSVDLHIKPLDMNMIIASVRAQLLDEVSGREIVWKVAPLPLTKADSGLMKILWGNLIGNAVKYTRTRAKAIIEIGTMPSEDAPVFFIKDNGVGFPPKYSEQLFSVFERLHKVEDFEGSGIGLAIVKRIVERHGGKIWAESKPDESAIFYFSLE